MAGAHRVTSRPMNGAAVRGTPPGSATSFVGPPSSAPSSRVERARRWFQTVRPARKLKFTREGKYFVGITLGVGFAAINTGNNLLYLLLGMLLSLILLSGVLSELSIRSLTVVRRLPPRAQVGRAHLVEIEVVNRKRHVASYAIEVEDLRAGQPADKRCFFLKISPNSAQVAAYRRSPQRRGRDRHTGFRIATRFPFGLFEKSRQVECEGELIIYPAVDEIRLRNDDGGRRAGLAETAQRGSGDDILGLRPLRDGDDPRDIYWRKSTTDQLVVRERARDARPDIELRLEVRRPSPAPDDWPMLFERRIRQVASHAVAHIKRGDGVTITTSVGERVHADRNVGADRLLRFLALLEPSELVSSSQLPVHDTIRASGSPARSIPAPDGPTSSGPRAHTNVPAARVPVRQATVVAATSLASMNPRSTTTHSPLQPDIEVFAAAPPSLPTGVTTGSLSPGASSSMGLSSSESLPPAAGGSLAPAASRSLSPASGSLAPAVSSPSMAPGESGSLAPSAGGSFAPGASGSLAPEADGSLHPAASESLARIAGGLMASGSSEPLAPGSTGSLQLHATGLPAPPSTGSPSPAPTCESLAPAILTGPLAHFGADSSPDPDWSYQPHHAPRRPLERFMSDTSRPTATSLSGMAGASTGPRAPAPAPSPTAAAAPDTDTQQATIGPADACAVDGCAFADTRSGARCSPVPAGVGDVSIVDAAQTDPTRMRTGLP